MPEEESKHNREGLIPRNPFCPLGFHVRCDVKEYHQKSGEKIAAGTCILILAVRKYLLLIESRLKKAQKP
ncbi:hypothetical protein CK203_036569 [Vitis vinifera]|uniref:Uncharacterized protein n=1 Tax=Vitis vinifera TaxID=29760 RepID=A0A438DHE2_VITVI|nr:hypothetical protein CK203_113021 [Vitis vinifera]RVW89980.1 hypothetical protein CK203_036569 [Vitis vinifera]